MVKESCVRCGHFQLAKDGDGGIGPKEDFALSVYKEQREDEIGKQLNSSPSIPQRPSVGVASREGPAVAPPPSHLP